MRCLRAGALFHYEPRVVLRWRHHGGNLSWRTLWMNQCVSDVHRWYSEDVADRALVRRILAPELFDVGRALVDEDRFAEARRAFGRALQYARGTTVSMNARALVWLGVLCLPAGPRERAGRALVAASRRIDMLSTRRKPAVP
jgi:hypothetical protein